jgi:hypothetical protein
VKFIPHLQWLESRNKKSPKHNQNPCVCDHCCSQKTVKKPTLEEEERRDYQVRRLAKVVIESVALMPEWLDSFYIPLPELIQPDPRLLQKVK